MGRNQPTQRRHRRPLRAAAACVLLSFFLVGITVAGETELTQAPILDAPRSRPLSLPDDLLSKPVRGLRMKEDWDRSEKRLLWSYLALSALDAYQTVRQPSGFREANPMVASWAGDRPSVGEVVLFKAATTYGLLRLANRIPSNRGKRKLALTLLNTLQLSIDIHNERVTGGIVFDSSR